MFTSRNGVLFIARREALVLAAYQDGPHMSIGFGSNDPRLKAGHTITVRDAFARLRRDIEQREPLLEKLLKVPVEQHQYDALLSLYFQSGNRYAPAVTMLINEGKPDEAAALLPSCDRNLAGEQKEGLHKRRLAEQHLFLTGDYGQLSPIPFWRGDPRTTKREEYEVKDGDLPE